MCAAAGSASAQGAACADAPADSLPLQLEVFRNGEATNLIAAFIQARDGRMFTTSAELHALDLIAPQGCAAVGLDGLPGIAYRYDDSSQRLFVTASPAAIEPLLISLHARTNPTPLSRDTGALLNYSLSFGGVSDDGASRFHPSSATGAFEARVFGPLGVGSSGFVTDVHGGRARAIRLDTSWTWSDPARALTWRGGDTISGGFCWTRPIRMVGIQVRRDFETRPDLVTAATPVLSASAAAPSALEVMLGSSVVLSRRVGAGPIQVSDLPILQAQGAARLVLRDAYGHVEEVSASYFATPDLLRPGALDFSLDAGFARRNFGIASADYDTAFTVQGSVRYGLSNALTVQGHGEAGSGLVNGGAGVTLRVGDIGAVSLAAAGSAYRGDAGALFAVAVDSRIAGVTLALQGQQRAGAYRDLAAVTSISSWRWEGGTLWQAPRSMVQAAVSAPLALKVFDAWGEIPTASLALGAADDGTGRRTTVNATLRARVAGRLTAQMSGYAMNSRGRAERGLFLGLSLPLGPRLDAGVGAERAGGRSSAYVEVRRPEQLAANDVAWQLRADQSGGLTNLRADGVYRSNLGRVSAEVSEGSSGLQASAALEGALVWMGRPMLAAERLEQPFAVADVGAPGVQVRQQNRAVGRSDRHGQLLVANLNAYEGNRLDIDLDDVPLSDAAPVSRVFVNPAAGAGVVARFGVHRAPAQAEVVVTLADGAFPLPGAVAALNGGAADSVVGYDGRLFLSGLAAANDILIDLGDAGQCHAALTLDPKAPAHDLHTVCR